MRTYRTLAAEFSILVLIAGILGAALAVSPAGAQAAPPPFQVFPEDNQVEGWGWSPGEVVVAVAGYDFPTIVDEGGWFYLDIDAGVHQLVVDDVVTVTQSDPPADPPVVATHTVQYVSLDSVDYEADTVAGTADPNDEVEVNNPGTGESAWDTADPTDGSWEVVFPSDITEETTLYAQVWDGDGRTVDRVVPSEPPTLAVSVGYHSVEGYGWPAESDLTVTIDGYSEPASTDAGGYFHAQIDPANHEMAAGQLVTVATVDEDPPGTPLVSLSHTIQNLTVDPVDYDNNVVSGTADDGAMVGVQADDQFLDVEATGNTWTADFAPYDITNETYINVQILEGDGVTYEGPPEPPQAPTVGVGVHFNVVEGYGWAPDAALTLTVDGYTSAPGELVADGGGSFRFDLDPGVHQLAVGQVLTVSEDGGGPSATHTVQYVTLDSVDYEADTVAGTADPGTDVEVANWYTGESVYVTADGNGDWDVVFPSDITEEMAIAAQVWEGDGYTFAELPEPPSVQVSVQYNAVGGHGWAPEAALTLTVDGYTSSPGELVADGGGSFGFDLDPGVHQLAVGQVVTVSEDGGGASATHTVQYVTLDSVDYEADTVAGTADPGTDVEVWNWDIVESVSAAADGNGDWLADFSPTDITEGQNLEAFVHEGDGSTFAGLPQPPEPEVTVTPDANLGWTHEVTVEGVNWPDPATSEMTFAQCVGGPGPDTCVNLDTDPALVTATDGAFSMSTTVTREINPNVGPVDCAFDNCGLMALHVGGGFGGPDFAITFAPLDFDPTSVDTSPLIRVLPEDEFVFASGGWPDGETVELKINGASLDPAVTAVVGQACPPAPCGAGGFGLDAEGVHDITAGDAVTVTVVGDESFGSSHVVQPLTITDVDYGADTVTGTAAGDPDPSVVGVLAGPDLTLDIPDLPAEGVAERFLTAEGTGDWIADFSVYWPFGGDPYDLTGQDTVMALGFEGDGETVIVAPSEDSDGIPNEVEDGAPNNGDGNNDGIPDSQQDNVASLPNAVDGAYVTLESPAGTTLTGVSAVDPATLTPAPPEGAVFPVGVFDFEVQVANAGDSASVVLYLPAGVTVDAYYKLGGDPVAWSLFGGATFAGGQVTLALVDGGAGDQDGTANGTIVEPGGPADVFDFAGFFSPVDNPPVLNTVKAGRAIPVKFSLNGDQGLDVIETGYPLSRPIACDGTAIEDGIEETVTAGSSSLSYDAAEDQYTYVWKTYDGWSDSCRQFVLQLTDGTEHVANFEFR